jgi:ATP-dependent protease ClpP protease subunit
MAVVIDLQGEFGWQIRPKTVANKLSRVNGEDVIVRLSTIGGDVFDGADVVNLFMDFRRDNPKVKMSLEIKAIAASYGSALMSAPIWDDIGISQVSAFMMHKASTFAYVNADDAAELIKFLSGLDNIYSQMYADRSGKTQAEALSLMADETWYFGQEIIDQGFADKIITMDDPGGDPLPLLDADEDRNIFIVDFKNQREALMNKQKEEAKRFDSKRAVACLRVEEEPITEPIIDDIQMANPGIVPDEITNPAPVGNLIKEVPKVETKQELIKELPGVYDESVNDGVMKERDRVKALTSMKVQEEYKDIPEVHAVIDKAIAEGMSPEATQPLMMAAMVKIMKDPARMAAIESPDDIAGGDGEEIKPEGKKQAEV